MAMSIITPTVGRKVWYRPCDNDLKGPNPMSLAGSLLAGNAQPLDATVIAVWGDRCINVLVTDIMGKQFPVLSCTLLQDDDPIPQNTDGKPFGRYCEWMPYQVKQAAKDAAANTPAPEVETVTYLDGTEATGAAPLPADSPST